MSGDLGKGSNQIVSRSRDYFFFFRETEVERSLSFISGRMCTNLLRRVFLFCLFVVCLCGSFDESISICVRALPGQPLTVVQTEQRRRLSGSLNALVTCVKSLADSLSIFNSKKDEVQSGVHICI